MRFQVECFENVDAFKNLHLDDNIESFKNQPLRRVMNLTVEANSAEGAAQEAWEIGNAPWEPEDAKGVKWPHDKVRSMSSGDVVLVHTPDGPVAYGCAFMGWIILPPDPEYLPGGVTI